MKIRIEIIVQDTEPKLAMGVFKEGKLEGGTYPIDLKDLKELVNKEIDEIKL